MIRIATLAVCALLAAAIPSQAGSLPKPTGKVVLTVTGKIDVKNDGDKAVFDMAMLESLPQRNTTVETPWTTGKVAFDGPLGSAILDAVGASGKTLVVTALNDYSAEIPAGDLKNWPVILANKMDGAYMSVQDKGPLFVIYPFDADAKLYSELYFNRSVWQVKSIEVR